MRGLYSSKTKIRHQIFTEIARLAYEGDIEKEMDDLPYKILPGEIATYRDSIFLEKSYRRRETACGNGTASSKHFRACANFQGRRSQLDRREIL